MADWLTRWDTLNGLGQAHNMSEAGRTQRSVVVAPKGVNKSPASMLYDDALASILVRGL